MASQSSQGTSVLVAEWIGRMAARHGGIVYGNGDDAGVGISEGKYDWGQALCREQYGVNWTDVVPDAPSLNDVSRANRWEAGEWPSWVDKEKTVGKG